MHVNAEGHLHGHSVDNESHVQAYDHGHGRVHGDSPDDSADVVNPLSVDDTALA